MQNVLERGRGATADKSLPMHLQGLGFLVNACRKAEAPGYDEESECCRMGAVAGG